ncbi:alpha-galactosidase [Actinomyces ruminicola]|uniref:Alpha-galactosidase n=1 Tax=Actinomyces ruminicola TaxID=332524 RepID=A0A1G9T3Q4_9ACTO|nr:alpha-galactosidase [Actinomyces ruminicola]SDM42258.1 alpha-galactosidase [Actinomyces ruminicola]
MPDSRSVHLRRGGTSLVLGLLSDRHPVVRHWGEDLGELDDGALADIGLAQNMSTGSNQSWTAPDLPVLPLPHLGWSARPAVLLHRADGSAFSVHPETVTHDVETVDAPGGQADVVTSTATDPVHGIELTTVLRLEPTGLVRLRAEVTDTAGPGAAALEIDELTPVLPVPSDATELLDMTGHHAFERQPVRTPFNPGTRLRESWEGRTGHDAATWLAAGTSGFGWRRGRVHAVHLAWSGNTRVLASHPQQGHRLLGGGELLQPGEIVLGPGQSYATPWLVGSWGEGLDALVARAHAHVRALPSYPTRPRPVLLNTWEAVYFKHDLRTLKALADEAAAIGIERFVVDDGWFGSRRGDTSGLGDWQVSAEVWPTGLEPLAEHVRALGMEMGLWFEPEMVNLDSDLARSHPEWVLSDGAGGAIEHRHQRVLDLTAPGAWDYLYQAISDLVERLGLAYIKWDHNSTVLAAGHMAPNAALGTRYGAPAVHEQTLALYRLLDALHERFPDLEIESCCGGGGRIDLGIIEHTQRVWTSDCNDAHDRANINRGTMTLLPPELIGTHVGAGCDHTTLRSLDISFRAATALWGHMGVEWDLLSATDADKQGLAELIDLHKQLRPLLHAGTVVHADVDEDDAVRIQGVVAPDRSEALYGLTSLGQALTWPGSPRPLPGLDPGRTYRVRLAAPLYEGHVYRAAWTRPEGVVLPGSYLVTTGLSLPVIHPDHSLLVRVTAV